LGRSFAGDKLTFVKSFGVNQQALDLFDNEFAAKFIDIGLILFFYILQNIDNDGFFFVRKKKRFIDLILEKIVGVNMFCQFAVPEKIGMDQQNPAAGLCLHLLIDLHL